MISFGIPEKLCKHGDQDISCVTDKEYMMAAKGKYIVTLQNKQTFEQDNYSGSSPIVEESDITWHLFPRT